jgi:hypothetical protein
VVREKREHTRAVFDAQVTFSGDASGEARAFDISVGGMFLGLEPGQPSPRVGAQVTLHFALPGLDQVEIPAFVRWIKHDGFGVQFGLLGPRITHAIGKLTVQSA